MTGMNEKHTIKINKQTLTKFIFSRYNILNTAEKHKEKT